MSPTMRRQKLVATRKKLKRTFSRRVEVAEGRKRTQNSHRDVMLVYYNSFSNKSKIFIQMFDYYIMLADIVRILSKNEQLQKLLKLEKISKL